MEKLPIPVDADVLVGHAGSDDAGVYRMSDDSALVITVDFFAPIVDDPYDFGRIAAANSLSDVYAMGGRPLVALNVAAFPEGKLPAEVLADILRGGVETAAGAGCAVIGGHTVNDAEPKYGLCVVGTVHPDKVVTNGGAQAGDALILTKPLGTGILSTVLKAGKLDAGGVGRLVEVMTTLNDKASAKMLEFGATACTDVTGYGLAGHALEMARAAGLTIRIVSAEVPALEGALAAAGNGHLTGGGNNNRAFVAADASIDPAIGENLLHVICDPQTAGGLLIAVPRDRAPALMDSLEKVCPGAAIVGEFVEHDGVSLEIV